MMKKMHKCFEYMCCCGGMCTPMAECCQDLMMLSMLQIYDSRNREWTLGS